MKVSKAWLQESLQGVMALPETAVLIEQLTMAGLEVDAVEQAADDFSGVVVGEIISITQHPDADKLRVCQVQGSGQETVQVVCGAANAAQGLKIPFAEVGAVLPGDFKIKKAKLRGIESFGMLCAAQELGMADESDGLLELPIDATVGQTMREYLSLDDSIIEIDLTPNRGDCLSMRGVAREAATLNQKQFVAEAIQPVAAASGDKKTVHLEAPEECSIYASRVIKNIDVSKPSPIWMQEKLRRAGIRSIDAVVDITNFVLLELGQPMHAFDLDKIVGDIRVRQASTSEEIELLDGQTLELKNQELVIADDKQALALAGIMGGQASSVQAGTQNILLEAAFFDPTRIAGRARTLGLHTDSSHRFERGVDYTLPMQAIERASQLLLEIVGGEAGESVLSQEKQYVPSDKQVHLRRERITSVLGLTLDDARVEHILLGLGFVLHKHEAGWLVDVPSWRFDVSIEADLLEEIARIYGYSELPVRDLPLVANLASLNETLREPVHIAQSLLQRGYQEVISYAFIPEIQHQQINPLLAPIAVQNPISSDMSVMRSSLWSGLLQTLDYNAKRQTSRLKVFEEGLIFLPGDETSSDGKYIQRKKLAGAIMGGRQTEGWVSAKEDFDFYDIKSDVEALLDGLEVTYQAGEHVSLHPGQTAKITDKNQSLIGYVGALHPQLQSNWGFATQVFLFELDYALIQHKTLPAFKAVSKYPEVRRDLAVLVDKHVSANEVLNVLKEDAGDFLKDLILFDNYEGKGIDSSKKSIGVGLIFQRLDTTLTEEEVNIAVEKIKQSLHKKLGASLRE